MARFLVKRLLWALLLCLAITFVTFVIFFRIPADPARMLLPEQAPSQERIAWARHKLGIDRPIHVQYAKYVWRTVHLDFGISYQSRPGDEVPVREQLLHAAPVTASVMGGAMVLWLLLPWIAFAFLYAALYTRMLRANVTETLHEDYVRTARAKGAGEGRVLRAHVLRDSLLTVVTMLGMDFAVAVGNAIYVEPVFSLPGLGGVSWGALRSGSGYDLPTILGVTLTVSFAVIALNLLVDLLYSLLDPRIRVAA